MKATQILLYWMNITVSKYLRKAVFQVQCLRFIALKCSNSALGPSPANVFKVKQKPPPQWVNKGTFRWNQAFDKCRILLANMPNYGVANRNSFCSWQWPLTSGFPIFCTVLHDELPLKVAFETRPFTNSLKKIEDVNFLNCCVDI